MSTQIGGRKAVGEPAGKRGETTRMFESDFIEYFSRIHPITPFVAWIPVIAVMLYRSQARHVVSVPAIVGLFALGLLTWTLMEYVLHRWVFHWINDTAAGKRIHFLIHGVHHDFPSDKDRLVMPLGFSIPLGIIVYGLIYVTIGQVCGEAFFAGMVLGYLGYDGTHYAVHHFRQSTRVGRYVKRHHMLHHHVDNDGGFGVSTPLWDIVFGTMPKPKQRSIEVSASAGGQSSATSH